MSLIKCFDCGKKVSDKAAVCVHCGCPLAELRSSGSVSIFMPSYIASEWGGLYTYSITVFNNEHKRLWLGKKGEIAEFVIDAPTEITVDFDGNAKPVKAMVYKNKKYAIIQDRYDFTPGNFVIEEIGISEFDKK